MTKNRLRSSLQCYLIAYKGGLSLFLLLSVPFSTLLFIILYCLKVIGTIDSGLAFYSIPITFFGVVICTIAALFFFIPGCLVWVSVTVLLSLFGVPRIIYAFFGIVFGFYFSSPSFLYYFIFATIAIPVAVSAGALAGLAYGKALRGESFETLENNYNVYKKFLRFIGMPKVRVN